MDEMRKIILTLIIPSFMSFGLGRVHLEIQNVDTDAGTLDIYMTSQTSCSYCDNEIYNYWPNTTNASYWYSNVEGCTSSGNQFFWSDTILSEQECQDVNGLWFDGDVWGFQFYIRGITITGIDGGTANQYLDWVDFKSQTGGESSQGFVLGSFIFTPTPIPSGEGILLEVTYINPQDIIYLPHQYGCGLNIDNNLYVSCDESFDEISGLGAGDDTPVIGHDTIWLPFIFTTVGDGYNSDDNWVYGCTYDTATNYNPNSTFDDGSCDFMWGDVNHDGILTIQDLILIVNEILNF